MKTDIEIAQTTPLRPIREVAAQIGIPEESLEPYGKYIAKVPYSLVDKTKMDKSHLILVTAITPTRAGIGKTTVSIGLAMGLHAIGKKAVPALREPSLGPCFGMKGGAAGGGYAQVLPMEKINLHFTGDFHAITSAHNMIAALLDNYLFQHLKDGFVLKQRLWNRVMDVNDRSLRNIITGIGKGNGIVQESGFDITPASEIMAILCFANDEADLRRRIDNILLGITPDDHPFTVKDLGITGSIMALLSDAISPNLVQTVDNTPAFIHGGPFANIAHGCNSVMATKMAMTFGDYAITEAGFGADLGAEKFFDIKCRKAGLEPALTVLVVTAQALKMHGGAAYDHITEPNLDALIKGFDNLDRHVHNLQRFGQSVVVAFNYYSCDTEAEINEVKHHCEDVLHVDFAVNKAFAEGAKGAEDLAKKVVRVIDEKPSGKLKLLYEITDTPEEKIEKIACGFYGAKSVTYLPAARRMLQRIKDMSYEHFPVCIAKTQYSFSTDAKKFGAPSDFPFSVRDIVINAGAEMLVVIAGDIMRMPGLPKSPQAERIDYVNGTFTGLS